MLSIKRFDNWSIYYGKEINKVVMELIDKAEVVTEIDKIINETNNVPFTDEVLGKLTDCKKIKNFINILEVKEVDINKEISQFIDANFEKATIGHKLSLRRVAKHFFELGLKAKRGE